MIGDITKIAIASVVLVAVTYAAAYHHYCGPIDLNSLAGCARMEDFGDFYGASLRGSLFAGFLTLGGFLLSLKTFIVVNMKKEVFDNQKYKDEWNEQKKIDTNNKLGQMYDPLKYLASLLFFSIASCVLTAILQLTLGLVGNLWAAIVCLWSAAISIGFLMRSLWLIRANLNRMFEFLSAD